MRNFIWNIEVKIQKRGRDKRMLLRSGQLYKQKGGELCQIIALAKDYETKENRVVFQELYGTFEVQVCSENLFDTSKEECMFTLVDRGNLEEPKVAEEAQIEEAREEKIENSQKEESRAETIFFQFLDAESSSEKIELLEKLKPYLDVRMVNNIAASMDLPSDEDDVEAQYTFIMQNLKQRSKFECSRFR